MKIFNEYFSNIVSNLDIQRPPDITVHHDPVLNVIKKIEDNPSMLDIKKTSDEIKCLDEAKANQFNDIPTKVTTEYYDIFATLITENFNKMIENSVFPVPLKQADIKPIYKKDSRYEKKNYRPVSSLPNLSKIYGRCLYTKINK